MKTAVLFILMLTNLASFAQQAEVSEKKRIEEKINLFFKALEKRDTILYKSLVFTNGQIWTVRQKQDTLKNSIRTFKKDMAQLTMGTELIEERPYLIDIQLHHDIAVAWVPYHIQVGGKFLHCGIDVFTFIKTKEGWKIVNATYSIEPEGCAELKNKYHIH